MVTDVVLIKAFYEWSEEKSKFQETEVVREIKWMHDNSLIPKLLVIAFLLVSRECITNAVCNRSILVFS